METRKNKRKRMFGVFSVLVYMNTKKETQKKIRWFSLMRIIIIGWNFVTFMFHVGSTNMGYEVGIIQHIVGMVIEYSISGIFENSIIRMNKFINKKTLLSKNRLLKQIFIKYFVFSAIFTLTYTVVYVLRMSVLSVMGYSLITLQQFQFIISVGVLFGFTAGPVLAFVISYVRDKRLKIKIIKNKKESLKS